MKKISLVLLITTSVFSAIAQTNETVAKYINTYKELAIKEEMRTGVPASITLAQGILESQSGTSGLSLSSNNHFGIKCKNDWKGATVNHDDDARDECFRSYPSVEDSYRDHSDFLRSRPHYGSLFNLDPADYEAWAHGLKKAGYATNPAYAKMLIKTINENNLQQYTLIALERMGTGNQQDLAVNTIQDNSKQTGAGNTTENIAVQAAFIQTMEIKYPSGTFDINNTKVVFAAAGTSLFALASNSNIAYKKLLEYNGLFNEDILEKDQLIYLERKPKKSESKEFHVVEGFESLEEISTKEGVDVESLYEFNKIQRGMQPASGEKVYLRPGKPPYYPKLIKHTAR